MIEKSQLINRDPYLEPFRDALQRRMERAALRELQLTDGKTPLTDLANGHLYYGLHKTATGWVFREKAPNATAIYLFGDFSEWKIEPRFALKPIGNGDWEIELPESVLANEMLYLLT